jgi:hypothetical protein
MSSGFFDISTGQPEIADFTLIYRTLKEIWEELFNKKEVQRDIRKANPFFFHDKPGIREIKAMLEGGRDAVLLVTGFCIDLVRLVPELTTVLVVRDPSYHSKYWNVMKVNAEYRGAVECKIQCGIVDAERFLREEFPVHPGRPSAGLGFDPTNWTLTGAFCFHQGMKKAVAAGLLS